MSFDWNHYAQCYDTLLTLRPYQEMLTQVAELCTDVPVLDAGCGTGNVSAALLKSASIYTSDIVALDISPEMRARAEKKLPTVHFMHGDLDITLPFADGTFGTIVCVNALYAVRDPCVTLQEYWRLLRSGGKIILVTPRIGYENGLILKAHAGNTQPDGYWCGLHTSPERERRLIYDAVERTEDAEALLELAAYNRQIASSHVFHFFSEETLRKLVCGSRFTDVATTLVYAKQNILLSARKD